MRKGEVKKKNKMLISIQDSGCPAIDWIDALRKKESIQNYFIPAS